MQVFDWTVLKHQQDEEKERVAAGSQRLGGASRERPLASRDRSGQQLPRASAGDAGMLSRERCVRKRCI